jgi:Fic family protein
VSLHQTAGHCVKLVLERRRAVIERAGDPERHEDGLDATARYREELTEERLLGWHSWLFPNSIHLDQPVRAGAWRTGPAWVVSGPVGRERVHFEGPEPGRVPGEMSDFLEWFNSPPETDGVIRAGTAHLWFAAVHPFQLARGG